MSGFEFPKGDVFDTVRASREPYIADKTRFGALAAGAFFAFLILWSIFAPLSTGAVVMGRITVEGDREVIQHLEGGRIVDINVSNGDEVKKGDTLLAIDPGNAMARVREVLARYVAISARQQRLIREYDGEETLEFTNLYSDHLDDEVVTNILMLEQKQFEMRHALFRERDEALTQSVEGILNVQKNLQDQFQNVAEQLRLLDEEIEDVTDLLEKSLIPKSRALSLRRTRETVLAQELSLASQTAETESRLADAKVARATFRSEYKQEIASMIQQTSVELEALTAGKELALDQLKRTNITAQSDGFVMNVKPNTIGEVLDSGVTALEIVPKGAGYIITGQLLSADANNIHEGLPAQITILAFKGRAAPTLKGRVKFVSPDVVIDEQSGQTYYPIQIEFEEESISKLSSDNELQPGFPAQVVVETAKQPVISYLLNPIRASLRNAFHEQ